MWQEGVRWVLVLDASAGREGVSRAAHRRIYSFFTAIRAPSLLQIIPIYTPFHPNSLFRP
jgi:hypothetical protein